MVTLLFTSIEFTSASELKLFLENNSRTSIANVYRYGRLYCCFTTHTQHCHFAELLGTVRHSPFGLFHSHNEKRILKMWQ